MRARNSRWRYCSKKRWTLVTKETYTSYFARVGEISDFRLFTSIAAYSQGEVILFQYFSKQLLQPIWKKWLILRYNHYIPFDSVSLKPYLKYSLSWLAPIWCSVTLVLILLLSFFRSVQDHFRTCNLLLLLTGRYPFTIPKTSSLSKTHKSTYPHIHSKGINL